MLLPDEPYCFTMDDGPEAFPHTRSVLLEVRALTWYGPSLATAGDVVRAAVDSFYASTFATVGMEVNVEVVSTEVYDEIAIVRSEQPVTVIAVADGTRTQAYFRELFVLRRTPDG